MKFIYQRIFYELIFMWIFRLPFLYWHQPSKYCHTNLPSLVSDRYHSVRGWQYVEQYIVDHFYMYSAADQVMPFLQEQTPLSSDAAEIFEHALRASHDMTNSSK